MQSEANDGPHAHGPHAHGPGAPGPGAKLVATLRAGTTVNVLRVRRTYAPTRVDRWVAQRFVPELGRTVEFEYVLGIGSELEGGRSRLRWALPGR